MSVIARIIEMANLYFVRRLYDCQKQHGLLRFYIRLCTNCRREILVAMSLKIELIICRLYCKKRIANGQLLRKRRRQLHISDITNIAFCIISWYINIPCHFCSIDD